MRFLGGTSWPVLTAGMRALALEQKTSSPGCQCGAGGDFTRHTQTGVSSCCPHYRSHPGAVLPGAGGKQASPSRFSPDSRWQDSTGWGGGWALPQAQGTECSQGEGPPPQPGAPSQLCPTPSQVVPPIKATGGGEAIGLESLSFAQAGGARAARNGFLEPTTALPG